jgi:hypothetical protein
MGHPQFRDFGETEKSTRINYRAVKGAKEALLP